MKLLDFASKEYVILTSYKRDGTPVPTVVWIAQQKNYLVVTTSSGAGKVKRIRNNSEVILCETNAGGSEKLTKDYKAKASEIIDEQEKLTGINAIRSKYGIVGKAMTRGPMVGKSILKITELTE